MEYSCFSWAADLTVSLKLSGSYCTYFKPYSIYQLLWVWKQGAVEKHERDREERTGERWSKGWIVRQEERKNFSMMKQPEPLCDWTRLPPMGGPAPWQLALSPREKLPYPSTPPYFSFIFTLSTPLLYTITRPCLFF